MIGVVIWEKEECEQAVIWCQDLSSLAYLDCREHIAESDYWPRSGDLVEMSNQMIGTTRYARQVTRVPQEKTADSPKEIRCAHNPDCKSMTFPVCEYTSPQCKLRCS